MDFVMKQALGGKSSGLSDSFPVLIPPFSLEFHFHIAHLFIPCFYSLTLPLLSFFSSFHPLFSPSIQQLHLNMCQAEMSFLTFCPAQQTHSFILFIGLSCTNMNSYKILFTQMRFHRWV